MKQAKKIFEIPFPNAAHEEKYYNEHFEPFVAKYKDWIHDIYFTYIPKGKFSGDVMGGKSFKNNKFVIRKALELKEKYGISICPTFNNIFEIPTLELGKEFLATIERLVAMGVDLVQVPYVHWMKVFKLKKKFPNIKFKDTVLQKTYFAQDVWLKAESGYDIVNIDRNLMRDESGLKKIKKAKEKFKEEYGRDIEIVLLANERCRGRCEIMDEHYMLNLKADMKSGYFNNPIGCSSCKEWFVSLEQRLKTTDIIPLRSEYNRLLQYVDVLKMHGRSDLPLWESTIEIMEEYINKDDEVMDLKFNQFKEVFKYPDLLKTFTKATRNCKIECWNCKYCDRIAEEINLKKDKQ